MKFEEIDKWLDDRYGLSYTDLKKINKWLCDVRERHNKEIEELNNRIDKAVEYIKYYGTTPEENDDTTCRYILKSLLNILRGKDD